MQWLHLQNPGEIDEIIALSERKPVLFFKHSTRCSVSLMAKRSLEHESAALTANFTCYIIDVLNERAASNHLADVSGITHQSPQVLAYAHQQLIYDASHHNIDATDALESLKLN